MQLERPAALSDAQFSARAPRIAFLPNRVGVVRTLLGRAAFAPSLLATDTSRAFLDSVDVRAAISDNSGNLIHQEAAARFLHYDRGRSGFVYGNFADADGAKKHANFIDDTFDYLVVSFSNIVRHHKADVDLWHAQFADFLGLLRRVKIVALGIGVQDSLDPTIVGPSTGVGKLLPVLNERASIVGTRGEVTAEFLHRHGVSRAVALGCPSLLAYARNAFRAYDNVGQIHLDNPALRISSAGRFGPGPRSKFLAQLLERFHSDYVFQSDIRTFIRDAEATESVVDPASGRLDDGFRARQGSLSFRLFTAFAGLYFFRTTDAWRQFNHHHDLFVGDRFHGGVAALQAGIPAVFLSQDVRVDELTDFFGLARLSIPKDYEVREDALKRCAQEFGVEKYRRTFAQRVAKYRETLSEAGLSVAAPTDFDFICGPTLSA